MTEQHVKTEGLVALQELPRLQDLFDGETELVWETTLSNMLVNCLDPACPAEADRNATFTITFVPDATLSSAVYSMKIKSTLPASEPPPPGRVVINRSDGKLYAYLRQGRHEGQKLGGSRPLAVTPPTIGEMNFEEDWRMALAQVLLNIDDPRVKTAYKRLILIKVTVTPDPDRMLVTPKISVTTKLAPARKLDVPPLYMEGDGKGGWRATFDPSGTVPGDKAGTYERRTQGSLEEFADPTKTTN